MQAMVLHAKGSAPASHTAYRYDRARVLRPNRVIFRPRLADPLGSPRGIAFAALLSAGMWLTLIGLIVAF